MSGIVGYIGKETVSLKCVLSVEEERLRRIGAEAGGWGLIYYQAGDILLRSHPFAAGDSKGLLGVLREAETTALLARFEPPNQPPMGKWNMQPFRYRQWVYVQEGRLLGLGRRREEIVSAMPDFLGRSLKGTSDAELVFHLVLSFLYDEGRLDSYELEPSYLVEVLKHTMAFLRRECAAQGETGQEAEALPVSFILGNGVMLAGFNSLETSRVAVYERRGRCDECASRERCKLYRLSGSARAAMVFILSRPPDVFDPSRFTELPVDAFFVVTQDGTTEIVPGRPSRC